MSIAEPFGREGIFQKLFRRRESDAAHPILSTRDFDEIRGALCSPGFENYDTALKALCIHLEGHLETASSFLTHMARAGGDGVALTIKLLLAAEPEPLVHTFMRNRSSRPKRESYIPADNFPYTRNTGFRELVQRKDRVPSFYREDLYEEFRKGRYDSDNPDWQAYYSTVNIVPIPAPSWQHTGLVGFLCADANWGDLRHTTRTLEILSSHIYDVLGAIYYCLCARNRDNFEACADHQKLSEACGRYIAEASWKFIDGRLARNDLARQSHFENCMLEFQSDIYNLIFPNWPARVVPLREGAWAQALRAQSGALLMHRPPPTAISNLVREKNLGSDRIWSRVKDKPAPDHARMRDVLQAIEMEHPEVGPLLPRSATTKR